MTESKYSAEASAALRWMNYLNRKNGIRPRTTSVAAYLVRHHGLPPADADSLAHWCSQKWNASPTGVSPSSADSDGRRY